MELRNTAISGIENLAVETDEEYTARVNGIAMSPARAARETNHISARLPFSEYRY